jgi:uncharacterized membrane protein YjfL (UPF0719 family)
VWEAALYSLLFGAIGIALVIVGLKLLDWLTPGKMQEEILQKNNLSAAIVCAAFIIGICMVIAKAIG